MTIWLWVKNIGWLPKMACPGKWKHRQTSAVPGGLFWTQTRLFADFLARSGVSRAKAMRKVLCLGIRFGSRVPLFDHPDIDSHPGILLLGRMNNPLGLLFFFFGVPCWSPLKGHFNLLALPRHFRDSRLRMSVATMFSVLLQEVLIGSRTRFPARRARTTQCAS